jgi:glycosyltransferase involved in cell wall biosynthesis
MPVRISLITGLLVAKDAISSAALAKVRGLDELSRDTGEPLDLRVYAIDSDFDLDGRLKVVEDVSGVVLDTHFLTSELIIYEFGIFNELFNSIHLAPVGARKIVHFHNITPPELMPKDARRVLTDSQEQMTNVFKADSVIVGSRFNEETLIDYGIDRDKITFINYVVEPPSNHSGVSKDASDEIIEALYVGRLTPSKGVLDLLEALILARAQGVGNIHLTIVGNLKFSSEDYLEEIRAYIETHDLGDCVDLPGEVDDKQLGELYGRSHLFLIASYHEGFCIPVIEALVHGCYVISYDGGNLAYVGNELGNVVGSGDRKAMAQAIVDYSKAREKGAGGEVVLAADLGPISENEFRRRAADYSADFSYERFRDRLRGIVWEE